MRRKTKKRILIVAIAAALLALAYGVVLLIGISGVDREKREYPTAYTQLIQSYATEYGLDPYLVTAIMRCESSNRPDALSSAGAMGLMQVMPDTGAWIAHKLGEEPFQEQSLYLPDVSLRFGCWYLRFLSDRLQGNLKSIVAAYNAGHGSVEKWLADPAYSENGSLTSIPFPETARYVEKVFAAMEAYQRLYPALYGDVAEGANS